MLCRDFLTIQPIKEQFYRKYTTPPIMTGNKLARYFGLGIEVLNEVEPQLITTLKHRAELIFQKVGFDPEEYFLYIHNLHVNIIKDKSKFWAANIPVQDRVESFSASFRVNPKQRSKLGRELIKFYDAYLLESYNPNEHNIDITSRTKIEWSFPGTHLIGGSTFKTHLVTFVSKELSRASYRKIKLYISAQPTEAFSQRLKSEKYTESTKFDVPLSDSSEVNFILKNLSDEERTRTLDHFLASEKRRMKELRKQHQTIKAMEEQEQKRVQPSLSIAGSVNTLNVVTDSSNFTINQHVDGLSLTDVYQKMLKILESSDLDTHGKNIIASSIGAMAKSTNKSQYIETFKVFMDAAKTGYDLFKDFIPMLVKMI